MKIFLLLVIVSAATLALGFDLDTDTAALKDLYQDTAGDKEWKVKWDLNGIGGACTWNGISCGTTDGVVRVKVINLDSNGLHGSLPKSFSNLDALEYVRLSNNDIGGAFPRGPFPHLVRLELQKNEFSGQFALPPTSTLKTLNLYHNYFEGDIDPQLLAGLDELCDLRSNHFKCPIKGNDNCKTDCWFNTEK